MHTKIKNAMFWDITPCSPLKVNWRFGGTYRLHLQGRRISRARNQRESRCLSLPPALTPFSCSAYSSTLKTEAIYSSETSLDIQRTTRRYIPEDSTLRYHRCENLKSYSKIHYKLLDHLLILQIFFKMRPSMSSALFTTL
jgi:hypothetical protein